MKKSTKKTLMALGIIFIFGLSSVAFVFSGVTDQQSAQFTQLTPLNKSVVDGDIDPRLEAAYIQNGFTFLKFYYNDTIDNNLISFADQAPEYFTTPAGRIQLIVLKIQSTATYARVLSINGAVDMTDLTADKIYNALCSSVIAPPAECVIGIINTTS